jgi:hypothetical protein
MPARYGTHSFAFWNTFKFTGKGLENWNVGQVRDASEMFYNAINFNAPIQTWDVRNMELFNEMFRGADAFNQPLDNWIPTSATSFWGMFRFASNFNQNLCSWGDVVSLNVNTTSMFAVSGCEETNAPDLGASVSGPWCQSCDTPSPPTTLSPTSVNTPSPSTTPSSSIQALSIVNHWFTAIVTAGLLIALTLDIAF